MLVFVRQSYQQLINICGKKFIAQFPWVQIKLKRESIFDIFKKWLMQIRKVKESILKVLLKWLERSTRKFYTEMVKRVAPVLAFWNFRFLFSPRIWKCIPYRLYMYIIYICFLHTRFFMVWCMLSVSSYYSFYLVLKTISCTISLYC